MPTITKSIGTTSRDYSTITAWEADLDNSGVYTSGDDAVGECYADSAFDELVLIDGGSTVGLSERELTVAVGERHDGTAGTGASLSVTATSGATSLIDCNINDTRISWLEITCVARNLSTNGIYGRTKTNVHCHRNIVHGLEHNGSQYWQYVQGVVGFDVVSASVSSNLIYDIKHTSPAGGTPETVYARGLSGHTTGADFVNNTVFDVDSTNFSSVGIANGGDRKNNIACSCGTTCFSGVPAQSDDHNLSSDATATGTGSLTNKAAVNQFVSIASGSEDLHLKSGADAINAGTDLGTTPAGVNIDIDGRDRDAEGDTWDIGAHEFVAAGGGPTIHQGLSRIKFGAVRSLHAIETGVA